MSGVRYDFVPFRFCLVLFQSHRRSGASSSADFSGSAQRGGRSSSGRTSSPPRNSPGFPGRRFAPRTMKARKPSSRGFRSSSCSRHRASNSGRPSAVRRWRRYLVVEAADGYRAVFALPELDPAFSDRVILLADRRDGKPLDGKEGPLRVSFRERNATRDGSGKLPHSKSDMADRSPHRPSIARKNIVSPASSGTTECRPEAS